MLGEPIGGKHIGISWISGRVGVRIVRPRLFVRCWIVLLIVEGIFDQRLQRLVMRRQRAVFQSTRHPNPSNTIRVQSEWASPAQRLYTFAFVNICGNFRSDVLLIIGVIEARPLLLLCVPPDQLLALALRLSIRTCRRAVVDDAAIVRP